MLQLICIVLGAGAREQRAPASLRLHDSKLWITRHRKKRIGEDSGGVTVMYQLPTTEQL